jgi:colicin import membrane protein
MKPTTIILSLVSAALAGVAIVCVVTENDTRTELAKVQDETREQVRAARDKQTASERKAAEAEVKAKAAAKDAESAAAKVTAAADAHKKTDEDFAAAKDALSKNATKIAELEKARSESAARVNELTAEVAKLRDGSEVREANAKSKKAEADLEIASAALRETNSKMAEIEKNSALLTEENNRLKARSREIGSGSTPDHRPL